MGLIFEAALITIGIIFLSYLFLKLLDFIMDECPLLIPIVSCILFGFYLFIEILSSISN